MKKIILIFCILVSGLYLYGDTYTPPFPLKKDPPPKVGVGDEDDTGHRAPARPAYCSIDFDAAEVNIPGYDCADIETFEICDAESHVSVYGTDDCAEFVGELAQIHDTVYVIFHFDGFTLSGYFAR